MAQFCSCGSLIIGEHCTNKNCTYKSSSHAKPSAAKKTATAKLSSSEPKEKKSSVRRASKCITYNLYDLPKGEETK